jgi:2'-5' RNA ligase
MKGPSDLALVIEPPEEVSAQLNAYALEYNAKAANKWPIHVSLFLAVPYSVLDLESIAFKPFLVKGSMLYRTPGSKYMMLRIEDSEPLPGAIAVAANKHKKKVKDKGKAAEIPPSRIGELQNLCGNILGIPVESGRGHPHVTLGNMSQDVIDKTIETLQATFEPFEFLVDHVCVLKDVKNRFQTIKRIPLVEKAAGK